MLSTEGCLRGGGRGKCDGQQGLLREDKPSDLAFLGCVRTNSVLKVSMVKEKAAIRGVLQ